MSTEIEFLDSVPRGVAVPITLRVRNTRSELMELWVTGDPVAFDLVVTRMDGTEVWRRLHGATVAEVLQQVPLPPGEALEFSEQWDQRDNDGRPVPPGRYRVRGSVPAEDLVLASAARELVITP